jgi:hypothetical protein
MMRQSQATVFEIEAEAFATLPQLQQPCKYNLKLVINERQKMSHPIAVVYGRDKVVLKMDNILL